MSSKLALDAAKAWFLNENQRPGAKRATLPGATLPGATLADFAKDIDLTDIATQMRDMSRAARVDLSLRVEEDLPTNSTIVSLRVTYQALNSASPVQTGMAVRYVGKLHHILRTPLHRVLDDQVGDLALSVVPTIMLDRLLEILEAEPTSPSQATARDQ